MILEWIRTVIVILLVIGLILLFLLGPEDGPGTGMN
jgi:hypothetical protein